MEPTRLPHLTGFHRDILNIRNELLKDINFVDNFFIWRPCRVRVLILADGLDFDPTNDFGLSDFVSMLLVSPFYVRFDITLAHIDPIPVNSVAMMVGEPKIANRITGFKFNDPNHFAPDRYDVVFLFGIASSYSRGAGYPSDSLSDAELQLLAQFQNSGGGLFATGDHGALGKAMCYKVARARDMRLWASKFDQGDPLSPEDRVSMTGRYRNDTNRIGLDAAWQFDDQSDDVPQPISPVFYTRRSGIFRWSFPHPLLCGPNGPIRIMPDHPHEGECKLPDNTSLNINYTANLGPEFPNATAGGQKPLPEIISYNDVVAGATADFKDATIAQQFPGICAYDGHRAGVGRVVTDSTWHHFVNVNLTGVAGYPSANPKSVGFLATPAGQAYLEEVKAYFRNLAIWLSPASRIACMNSHWLWHVIYRQHVLEAVLTARDIGLDKISVRALWFIGRHARDVLGRFAGQCQSLMIVIYLLEAIPEIIPEIDPWRPRLKEDLGLDDDELPLVDMTPLLDAAFGAALVAINEQFGSPTPEKLEKLTDAELLEAARHGAVVGLERAQASLRKVLAKAGARPFLPGRDKRAE